jgi:hypothetical protein
MSFSALSQYPHSTAPTTTTPPSLPPASSTVTATTSQMIPQNLAFSTGTMFPVQQRPPQPANPPALSTPSAAAQAQAAAREKARISILLEINSALLQEVVNLQAVGKAGGPPTPAAPQQPSPTQEQGLTSPISATEPQHSAIDASKGPGNKPSTEYFDCMRRVQTNLTYLIAAADRAKKPGSAPPPAPGIMTARARAHPPRLRNRPSCFRQPRYRAMGPSARSRPPTTRYDRRSPARSPFFLASPVCERGGFGARRHSVRGA